MDTDFSFRGKERARETQSRVGAKVTPKEALKGAKVFAYGRVSTVKQEGTLSAQKAAVKESLESKGYKKDFDWVGHQFSGAKYDRDIF